MNTSDPSTHLSPQAIADLAIETILEKKGYDVLLLDIEQCSNLADFMLICTARNARQTQAIASYIGEVMKNAGVKRLSLAGTDVGSWVVLDYADVFIHVMQPRAREYYDLEALWGDAKIVKRIEGSKPVASANDDDLDEPVEFDAEPIEDDVVLDAPEGVEAGEVGDPLEPDPTDD